MFNRVITRYYKIILASMCLFIALHAVDGALSSQAENVSGQKSEVIPQTVHEKMFENFDNFIVYLKDPHAVEDNQQGINRKERILICNVAVELNPGMGLSNERVELRKIIYNTLKEQWDFFKIQSRSKDEIKIRLNHYMNAEAIKKVYFSKLVVL